MERKAPATGELMPGDRDVTTGKTGKHSGRATAGRRLRLVSGAVAALILAGCASTTLKHGHQFHDADLQQIQPGMTEDSVRMALGSPATTSALPGGNAYYYISSTTKQTAFFKEEEVDRKIVAVYFNPTGSVDKVAQYGMKDGHVFDFVKNETPAHMRDKSLISRFFRGVGPKQAIPDNTN
jgi:outer membrane protein assembly factor BamE (lipoprotein component of BamABCDE complex)